MAGGDVWPLLAEFGLALGILPCLGAGRTWSLGSSLPPRALWLVLFSDPVRRRLLTDPFPPSLTFWIEV